MSKNGGRKGRSFIVLAVVFILLAAQVTVVAMPDLSEYSRSFASKIIYTGASGEYYAEALERLGLFRGTGTGFELERQPNRTEALVSAIRLMGVEAEVLSQGLASPFSDVPAWAAAYAGYGEQKGVIQGMGGGMFGAGEQVTALQLAAMLLRTLGYDDRTGDFEYGRALAFAAEKGILDQQETEYYSKGGAFTRADLCYFIYRTLYSRGSDGQVLILTLLDRGAIDRTAACAVLERQGEEESEIRRALANGFSEAWLERLHTAIDGNESIPDQVKRLFKQSAYNWLKEPGMDAAIGQIESKLTNLVASQKARSEDVYFYSGYAVAYFMYPNNIALRNDQDLASFAGTVAHELRHGMTSRLYPNVLEEGFTELWSQEVDEGDYSYPYYYVNAAKLMTHLAGAEAANRADLTGGREHLFYAIESNTGVSFDKEKLRDTLSGMEYTRDGAAVMEAFSGQVLSIIEGWYDGKLEVLLEQAGSWQRFVDEMIVLGQLLYYPSSVIQRAESDLVKGAPADYYNAAYIIWVDRTLDALSAKGNISRKTLSDYWKENSDTRMYREYFGPRADGIFTGGQDGYAVEYAFDGYILVKYYGDASKAERFRRMIRAEELVTVSGIGFAQRSYE